MKKKIIIVGGGPSALMLALQLDTSKYKVTIYEKNNALARKFLVAGDGGLNLTHSETPEKFIQKYSPSNFIKNAFNTFNNSDFINFLNNKLEIKTYVGSSGKLFPEKNIKPIKVLNAFKNAVINNNVELIFETEWVGFDKNGQLKFKNTNTLKVSTHKAEIVVFCLGGASWPVTGSNGNWKTFFDKELIVCNTFEASNCSFKINWNENFISSNSGKALKNCSYSVNNKIIFGESVLTNFGIEGNGVYPLSEEIRKEIKATGIAQLIIDFKPQIDLVSLETKLKKSNKKSISNKLKSDLNLTQLQISLLKHFFNKDDFLNHKSLAFAIKNFQLTITSLGTITDAISTVGGISLNELDENFMLKQKPNHYCVGEMLDYDAPTGGYLLQSCFSMGFYLAKHLNRQIG